MLVGAHRALNIAEPGGEAPLVAQARRQERLPSDEVGSPPQRGESARTIAGGLEKAGERERCYYRLTTAGRRVLVEQRVTWDAYVNAVNDVMRTGDA